MEWHVDTGQRNRREAPLELDVSLGLLLVLSALEALFDDVAEHLLDLLHTELFGQLNG